MTAECARSEPFLDADDFPAVEAVRSGGEKSVLGGYAVAGARGVGAGRCRRVLEAVD